MPTYKHFEELPSWQAAAELYNCVLDLLEDHGTAFTSGYRNQLDRAALSVSNNIAEGFERMTTAELIAFLAIARGSASEVRSMMAVIRQRPKLRPQRTALDRIAELAADCLRQLTAWIASIEEGPIQGKRHLTGPQTRQRQATSNAHSLRLAFLHSLTPDHPLYNTAEAREARAKHPPGPHSQ
jgi:four helix bundle protein